jgi:hypothetical protein
MDFDFSHGVILLMFGSTVTPSRQEPPMLTPITHTPTICISTRSICKALSWLTGPPEAVIGSLRRESQLGPARPRPTADNANSLERVRSEASDVARLVQYL